MKGKYFFACCAAAASSVLLIGITPAQEYIISPAKDTIGKTSRMEAHEPRRAERGDLRGLFHRIRQPDDISSGPPDSPSTPPPQPEAPCLKELAEWFSVPIPNDATPGDIAFAIRQALSATTRYSGEVLSDDAFEECKAAIPTTKDTETFEAYHSFIKKVAGKKLLIVTPAN